MEFRTTVGHSRSDLLVNHQSKILMIGSCFTNNIGKKLIDHKFDVVLNPFGTLYNPISIKKAIEILIEERQFSEADIFYDKGMYNSFYHHSHFSSPNREEFLEKINTNTLSAAKRLKEANILLITFGTSYVYEYMKTKEVVGNCHKLPNSDFRRFRLTVEQITQEWSDLLKTLESFNPTLQVLFTVSPIRHLRDGAHDNQLSKGSLLLAIDELNKLFKQTSYFPSYEIMLDDLRDYRFYESDMCHPSEIAIDYIWEIFNKQYFDNKTEKIISEWQKIRQALLHKPFNPRGNEYIQFLKQTLLKLKLFQSKYPFICLNSEISTIEEKIQE